MVERLEKYIMLQPKDYKHLLALLAIDNGKKNVIFAGGTDLMVQFHSGHLRPQRFINIAHLQELNQGIMIDDQVVHIGALTTHAMIRNHSSIQKNFPNLSHAASLVGAAAIQNRGTIAGNIVNASPAGDLLPALLAYEATLEVESLQRGKRSIPYPKFHLGYKKLAIQEDEVLTRVSLKIPSSDRQHYYRKVGTREAQSISKVCMAATISTVNREIQHIAIALASVAPTPLRLQRLEGDLLGQKISSSLIKDALEAVNRDISPIDDIRSNQQYRLRVTQNLVQDFLESVH